MSTRTPWHSIPLFRLQRAQADLHRELCSVPPPPVELEPGTHRPHARVPEVPGAVADVCIAEPLGHQSLDRLAEQLRPCESEQPFGLGVHEHDTTELVHDHDRVGDELE